MEKYRTVTTHRLRVVVNKTLKQLKSTGTIMREE